MYQTFKISAELPIALATFRRNKAVSDVLGLAKGCAFMMVGMYLMGFLIKRAREEMSKDRERCWHPCFAAVYPVLTLRQGG